MKRVLLVDDEPLVLVGMQSMLTWQNYDAEIIGTARNGEIALQLIEQFKPDIVITDIKMPVKTGLDILRECRQKSPDLPVFIFLTSYEEFAYIKEAMQQGAVDYLVKLELTKETLALALEKAIAKVQALQQPQGVRLESASDKAMYMDKFFTRLYHNLFESRAQYDRQRADLDLKLDAQSYAVATCEVSFMQYIDREKQFNLYTGTMQMVVETLQKYGTCFATSLDLRHFNVCFIAWNSSTIETALLQASGIVRNYFSVVLTCGIGKNVSDAFLLAESYQSARWAFANASVQCPCVAAQSQQIAKTPSQLSAYKAQISRAFDELDTTLLCESVQKLVNELSQGASLVDAIDTASSLLYMAISLLPDGEANVENAFEKEPDGYRCLYKLKTTQQVCQWLTTLSSGLSNALQTRKQNYKQRIIDNVKQYIRTHLSQRLSLQEVATAFNFSPNYLSGLFAQYSDKGFVDYVTEARVDAAKIELSKSDKKVYEVAEELGFESAFYFSKVFKKVTGLSPREYQQAKKE